MQSDPTSPQLGCMVCDGVGVCQIQESDITFRNTTSPCLIPEIQTSPPSPLPPPPPPPSPTKNTPLVIKIRNNSDNLTKYICNSCNGMPMAIICCNPPAYRDKLGRPVCGTCLLADYIGCMYCDSDDIEYNKATGCTTCLNEECSGRTLV